MNLLFKKEIFFVKFPILFPLVYLTVLYSFPSFETHLIFIPITGQMLHFYLDSQLWKFSEQHNKEDILKYL